MDKLSKLAVAGIKKFDIPTFEKWIKTDDNNKGNLSRMEYLTKQGDYYFKVGVTAWYDNGEEEFRMAIACNDDNVHNIFTDNLFVSSITADRKKETGLKSLENWYNQETLNANSVFQKYLAENYLNFEEEKQDGQLELI
jgi:hypothetical protein